MTQSITIRSGLANTNGFTYLRELIKLSVRAQLHRRQTRDWLALLNSQPLLSDLLKACPRLMYKIYRPYFSNSMSCAQRLGLLMAHYRFVADHGLGNIVRQAARAPLQLGSVAGKSGALYGIQLRTINAMEREGELILQLTHGVSVIYSVAFSFIGNGSGTDVGIGCLQGPNQGDTMGLVREATRDLHGMRPKSLMVRLVRQLGHDYGCQRLILVSNQNRTVHGATKKGLVHADYNELWQEMGAHLRADGDFELDCDNLAPPVMEEIASKKRSEARKRHETLCAIIDHVRSGLNAPHGPLKPAVPVLTLVPSRPSPQVHLHNSDNPYDTAVA
ncbi:VirK/YbjX family protein [Janthinobacterium agaricidamnosum]|uniref:DUF535 domain-containing protein n=1 Tax=Janthinobacterium agaricidamnosum NBRC 102515 = DSM 9628 TaxID=1349767 RepID=W0V2N2_9BURK|nr:VirK/YbjX family protein [Janthinobacterium agaricidamnosum]CDG81608.1 conserved hypothetical protein [Janthinobacterium agaricidamnosum NBRC 102515 = DSM 9628]